MPPLIGEAVLNAATLVDSLVADVIDGLRESLHPDFGVRSYRVYRVIRTWTGQRPGDGQLTQEALELRPQPRVQVWSGLRMELATCGVEEMGEIVLTEVSLTYTERQLTGGGLLGMNQELYIGLAEAHGQAQRRRLFSYTRPPFVDREKNMGWQLWLQRAQGDPGAAWEP
jgi:hypothetical protein